MEQTKKNESWAKKKSKVRNNLETKKIFFLQTSLPEKKSMTYFLFAQKIETRKSKAFFLNMGMKTV